MPLASDRYALALARALHRGGVRHVVIAPGSRNTPLTVAFSAPGAPFRTWLHLDERSAAYFALGLARQTGQPVAVLCTSGTAAANFLPAAVEARLSRVPLILLTADRPPELRDVGAAQTVDQVGLFSRHVKWAVDLPAADPAALGDLERYAAATGTRACAVSLDAPRGPVHLNVPFREPLVAPGPEYRWEDAGSGERLAAAPVAPSEQAVERFAAASRGRRGLIVCGPESGGLPADAIVALASVLGWPVVADPLSGLRTGSHDFAPVVETADTLVREPRFTEAAQPEVVLRFGAAPTSKPLNQWLAGVSGAMRIVVDPAAAGVAGWRDPELGADLAIAADPERLGAALIRGLDPRDGAPPEWPALWREASSAARTALRDAIDHFAEPFEGRPALDLAEALPAGATLVAGNSMPVRDLDSFFPLVPRAIRLEGTRGASGIDGVASTAAGAAAAVGEPVALLVGDLSFLHDLNGLWPVAHYGLNVTVVLVNNNGGGIFSFLPQRSALSERFEAWWGTPHGLELSHAVALQRGRHARLEAGDQSSVMAEALARPGLDVLELATERERNVELHRRAWAAAAAAVRSALQAARA